MWALGKKITKGRYVSKELTTNLTSLGILAFIFSLLEHTLGNIIIGLLYAASILVLIFDCYRLVSIVRLWGKPSLWYYKMKALEKYCAAPEILIEYERNIMWIGMLVLSFFYDIRFLPLACLLLTSWLSNIFTRRQPPLFLLLTSGADKWSLWLHYKLYFKTIPFQVNSLLQMGSARSIKGLIAKRGNFRTYKEIYWQRVAYELMDLSYYIILDTRFSSKAIINEATRIADAGFVHKTVLIIDEDSSHLLLESLETRVASRFSDANKCKIGGLLEFASVLVSNIKYLEKRQIPDLKDDEIN